jgi:hypothetical protein
MLAAAPRPLSAVEYSSRGTQDQHMTGLVSDEHDDIVMADVDSNRMIGYGPTTAPLQVRSGPTFFHDDD